MKVAKDMVVVNIPSRGGFIEMPRAVHEKLISHPSVIQAYRKADKSTIGGWSGFALLIREDDGSVTELFDEAGL